MNIARYDRAAAAAVLARALDSFRKTDTDGLRQGFIAMALALIDPARVVSLVESLPEEPGLDRRLPRTPRDSTRRRSWPSKGQERWQAVRNWAVSIWKPEGSDL